MWPSRLGKPRVYSPALQPGMVRLLYHLGKAMGLPMTRLVDQLIHEALRLRELPAEVLPHYQNLTNPHPKESPA